MASVKPKLTEKRRRVEDWLRRNRSLQRNEGGVEDWLRRNRSLQRNEGGVEGWLRRNRSLQRNEGGRRVGFGETEAY